MAIDPFSAFGTIWTVGSSVVKAFTWQDADKNVDSEWLAASGFDKICADKGIELRWARPNHIETLKLKAYHVVLEEDDAARVRYRLVNQNMVLMGKQV